MAADTLPVFTDLMREQRRSLVRWGLAVAAISAIYIGLYPTMGTTGEMQAMIENLPEAMVTAFGYEGIGSPGGWMSSTVYGLLGPVLLSVFAVATGARLIAGQEEDGTLELDLTSPVSRRRLLLERLAGLWSSVTVLVLVITAVAIGLVASLDMEVPLDRILAGGSGLLLLVLGFGTLAFAVGAATGRRGIALAAGAALAVVGFVFHAIGPTIDAGWMNAVSPFSWFLQDKPLNNGFDVEGLALLAVIPVASAIAAVAAFERRDLMV